MKCKNEEVVVIEINDMKIRKSKNNIPCEAVIDVIRDYDLQNKNNQCGLATRDTCISLLMLFANEVKKPFNEVSKKDIDRFLGTRNGSTLENYKMSIKKFFKWLGKPELVEHLKFHKTPETLTADMMWTEDEYLQLLKVVDPATKERDQAVMMLMWDLGAEKSVIENIKIGDVFDKDSIMRVKTTGKKRGQIKQFTLECIYSAPYIRAWLNKHPFNTDRSKPLFVQLNERTLGKPLHAQFVWSLTKKLQARSGIQKELRPHLIRHSRATDYAKKGITGDALKYRMRHWNIATQERYKHLHNEVYEDKIYEADTGIHREQLTRPKNVMMAGPCPKCGELNEPTNVYCSSCNSPLNQTVNHVEQILKFFQSDLYNEEYQIAKDEGRFLDTIALFAKFLEDSEEMEKEKAQGRKEVHVVKTSP